MRSEFSPCVPLRSGAPFLPPGRPSSFQCFVGAAVPAPRAPRRACRRGVAPPRGCPHRGPGRGAGWHRANRRGAGILRLGPLLVGTRRHPAVSASLGAMGRGWRFAIRMSRTTTEFVRVSTAALSPAFERTTHSARVVAPASAPFSSCASEHVAGLSDARPRVPFGASAHGTLAQRFVEPDPGLCERRRALRHDHPLHVAAATSPRPARTAPVDVAGTHPGQDSLAKANTIACVKIHPGSSI